MKLYFAAVLLPEHLNTEIIILKNLMRDKWGCTVGLKSPAHITLIPPFWMDEKWEDALQNDLDALCKNITSFTIAANGFSAFKPRTIFIKPVLHEDLKKLKMATDAFCKTHTQYGAKGDARPFQPHITIATRDLHKQAFAEAWPNFESKPFTATFVATGLSLLRHNTRNWDVNHTALFAAKSDPESY